MMFNAFAYFLLQPITALKAHLIFIANLDEKFESGAANPDRSSYGACVVIRIYSEIIAFEIKISKQFHPPGGKGKERVYKSNPNFRFEEKFYSLRNKNLNLLNCIFELSGTAKQPWNATDGTY